MILLPARPPERDLQASAHAALRRVRGFGKSVRSSAFILLNAIIDNPICELGRKSSNRRTEFSDMPSFLASLSFDHPRARIADALVIGDRDRLPFRRVNERERNSTMFAID
jgi:hypothetical protein